MLKNDVAQTNPRQLILGKSPAHEPVGGSPGEVWGPL